MELNAFAFNVGGLEERRVFGFNFDQPNKEDDEGIDLTKYNIFMLFDIRMDKYDAITKFPILQNYETREYYDVCTATGENSDEKRKEKKNTCETLVKHLYGYKKELQNFCSFVRLGDQIVFKISNSLEKNVNEMYIIPVYLEIREWESNFKKLKNQLFCLQHKNVLLIGDFNARVGDAQLLNEARVNLNMCIKRKRRSKDVFVDNFGRNLIPWSKENELTLLNGRTKSDYEGRFTCGYNSTTDLCFVKGDFHKYVTDFEVIQNRWESFQNPITVATSLSFVIHTPAYFSTILAAAIRPFEPYNEEQSETYWSRLFKKYKQQMIKKLYFENLFKAFAKIEYKMEFWELAKRFDTTCILLGHSIERETLIFVQKVEELFKDVINEGLIDYLPEQRDEFLDEDLSINDVLEITANINPHAIQPDEILIRDDFYERAIKSYNFNQVEIPAASDISISNLVNFIYYKIMLRRTLKWMGENNILNGHSHENENDVPFSCLGLNSIYTGFYVYSAYFDKRAFDSFLGNKVQMRALLCKLFFAGMSTKFLRKLENFISNYDEYRKSDDFFDMGKLGRKLSEVFFGCFFVVDIPPKGTVWCQQYLDEETRLTYVETRKMMRTIMKKFQINLGIWGIKLDTNAFIHIKKIKGTAEQFKRYRRTLKSTGRSIETSKDYIIELYKEAIPVIFIMKCSSCQHSIVRQEFKIQCINCKEYFHGLCAKLGIREIDFDEKASQGYKCDSCKRYIKSM